MSNKQLLAAAFTQMSSYEKESFKVIVTKDEVAGDKEIDGVISPHDIFKWTYHDQQDGAVQATGPAIEPVVKYSSSNERVKDIMIILVGIEEHSRHFPVNLDDTVHDLKQDLYDRFGWPDPESMRLIFDGKQLEDDKKLIDYPRIHDRSTIFIITRVSGGGDTCYLLDDDLLDPRYDFDFTHIRDDGRVFQRGSYTYKRPYGWKRIALKEYEDDVWLGAAGNRIHSSPGEWVVSYHGTSKLGIQGIVKSGYDRSRLRRERFGKGHYSTPDIEVAKGYAANFEFEGKKYLMVLQNRVNLANSTIIPKEVTRAGAEYFVTPSRDSIQPYGICIKEC